MANQQEYLEQYKEKSLKQLNYFPKLHNKNEVKKIQRLLPLFFLFSHFSLFSSINSCDLIKH